MVIGKNDLQSELGGRARHSVRAAGGASVLASWLVSSLAPPVRSGAHRVSRPNLQCGLLMTEAMIALAIVCIAILPLAYSFAQENKYLRRCYERAVAIEIVDGEMEIIRSGGWRNFTNGVNTLATTARSAANLPPGELRFTLTDKQARVEWLPAENSHGSPVVREAMLK